MKIEDLKNEESLQRFENFSKPFAMTILQNLEALAQEMLTSLEI